jgi:peptide/nickel transport system substrate-binding protein
MMLSACRLQVPSVPVPTVHLSAQSGGSVTEAVAGQIGPLNPLFETGQNDQDVDSLIYQGLTTVNSSQDVVPLLASGWKVSGNGLTYTVQLRQDVRWADGAPFTAGDVVFTYHLLQNPAYAGSGSDVWRDVQVQQLNHHAVQFTLVAPNAAFPETLRQGIIPEHIFSDIAASRIEGDAHSEAEAFGTGPFRVRSISQNGERVTLVRNTRARPRPLLGGFVFQSYQTLGAAFNAVADGQADTVGSLQPPSLASLGAHPNLVVRQLQTYSYVALLFNLQKPSLNAFFGQTSVRQALDEAIDRNAIVNGVLGGRAEVDPGPIPPTSWAYAPGQASPGGTYNPVGARAALQQAGWVLEPGSRYRTRNGNTFALSLSTPDGYPYPQVAHAIAGQLAAVGVHVTVHAMTAGQLVGTKLARHEYQLALVAFDMGPDPDQYTLWHSDPSPGQLNFSSPELPRQDLIDKDLQDGRDLTDRGERAAAYADFQSLIVQAAPAAFLFSPTYDYVLSKRIRGVQINPVIDPSDRLEYVSSWYVNVRQG